MGFFQTMASAQVSESPKLAESMNQLTEELKDARSIINQLQGLNKTLIDTNKMLVTELTNGRTDLFYMTSKSTRIQMTNKQSKKVLQNIESHEIIKSILSKDTLTATQLQSALDPLVKVWSSARSFAQFLPNARVQQNVDHCRPLFQLINIRPFLDDNMRTTVGMTSMLWQFSHEMHVDAMSFAAFRPGFQHKSELHAYLALISTCCLWNIYRESRINYPASSPICCDYTSDAYSSIMEVHPVDLASGPEPTRPSEEFIDIKMQMSRNRKRKKSN